jgi:hypothetical protein
MVSPFIPTQWEGYGGGGGEGSKGEPCGGKEDVGGLVQWSTALSAGRQGRAALRRTQSVPKMGEAGSPTCGPGAAVMSDSGLNWIRIQIQTNFKQIQFISNFD